MLRVGVIGCGLIATKKHLPALLGLRRKARVVAVCDLNAELARHAAKTFGVERSYGDVAAMLAAEQPDLVDVCTPPQTHAKMAIDAVERGAAVLLEKPMALAAADCDRMVEIATRCARPIGVIHNQLFNPAFVAARDLVANGAIGEFLGMRIWLSTPTDYMTAHKDHWAHRLPGGVLGETGPHAVYLSLAFLRNIADVTVHARKLLPEYPWSRFEDFRIELVADNGISSIWLSYGNRDWAAEVDILGSRGGLRIDLQAQSVLRYQRPALTARAVGRSIVGLHAQGLKEVGMNSLRYGLGRHADGHHFGIGRFVEALCDSTPVPVSATDGREVVRVMEHVVRTLEERYP